MRRTLSHGVTAESRRQGGVTVWRYLDARGVSIGEGHRRDNGSWSLYTATGSDRPIAYDMHYAAWELLKRRGPVEGVTRCECGSKYWDAETCHSCGRVYHPTVCPDTEPVR